LYKNAENSPQEMLRIINEDLRINIENFEGIIRQAKDCKEQLETTIESQDRSIQWLTETSSFYREMVRMIS
jgi:hypothetical protein